MRLLRVLTVPLLLLCAGVLWFTRPRPDVLFLAPQDGSTLACQTNLRKVSLAFAQYAQDFDGKFPRGVDPEDRIPETWHESYGGQFADDAMSAPFLHMLLQPYLKDADVWHCPSDSGWDIKRDDFDSRLGAVSPSSFASFGTSYYYYTIHGFAGLRPADVPHPSREILLFDGDFWHNSGNTKTLNALFADGHVESLTLEKFDALGNEQAAFLSTMEDARP